MNKISILGVFLIIFIIFRILLMEEPDKVSKYKPAIDVFMLFTGLILILLLFNEL